MKVTNYYEVVDFTLSGTKMQKIDPLIKLIKNSDCLKNLDLSYN